MAETDAQKRAAARKAKILARGNAGLQKLAQTARGEEAEKLYGSDSVPSSRPDTPSQKSPVSPSSLTERSEPPWSSTTSTSNPSSSTSQRTGQNRIPSSGPTSNLTSEQQAMQDQIRNMMSMLGGSDPSSAGGMGGMNGEGQMPDLNQLLASMMGMNPQQSPPPNLLGDLDDPAGFNAGPGFGAGEGMNGLPPGFPDLSNLPGMAGMPGMGGMGGIGGTRAKSWVEKVFPFLHFLSVILLVGFTVIWWEPKIRSTRWVGQLDGLGEGGAGNLLGRWSRLAGRSRLESVKSRLIGDIELIPIFWAFTTLELILQTTRFFILKSPPQPHSLISTFLPMLPPKISRPLVTGSRYLTMLLQTYKDGCLLIFSLGIIIILSEYLSLR